MVFKDYTFFSYVFSAIAVILLTGHAHGQGLCDNSTYKVVCESIVVDRTDPKDASIAACHKLIFETKNVRVAAQTPPVTPQFENCIAAFTGAISNTKIALQGLQAGDYATLRIYLLAAKTNYLGCDDGFQNSGQTNPIAKSTKLLMDIASVGVDLAALIK
nr:hypothetical protein CFP56_01630 [Quercus suber]